MLDKFDEVSHIRLAVEVLLAVLHSSFLDFFKIIVRFLILHDPVYFFDKISAIVTSIDHFLTPIKSRQLEILNFI